MTAAYVYLALSVLLFATTLAAVFPRLLRPHPASPLYFAAMILAFFIPQFIVLGAAITGAAALRGAMAYRAGQAGAALHVVAWTLLGLQLRRMHFALPVLDGAVVRDGDHPFAGALSDGLRASLAPARIAWSQSVVYNIPMRPRVAVTRAVVYRVVRGVRLKLDVYRPREAAADGGARPAVLYIHGGGWIMGTRRQSRFMMYELAAAGWVVFAISYRLAPRYPLPAAIEDCKAAVGWIREHGAEYGADPATLVAIGGSAGGHLASMLSVTGNDPRFQPGFEQVDTRVQGAVVLYGFTDLVAAFERDGSRRVAMFLERLIFRTRFRDAPDAFRAAQPVSYVSAHAPPTLFVHGTDDHLVPIEMSRRFARGLRDAGANRVHVLEVPTGQHAFEVFPSPLHQRAVRVVVRFLASVRDPAAPTKIA